MAEFPEEAPGRCFSCGFLSKSRGGPIPGTFYEVGWHGRSEGAFFRQADPKEGDIRTIPWCYRLVPDFFVELYAQTTKKGELDRQGVLEIIRKDRSCPKWEQYEIDRSPKEHLQKVEMLELQQRQEQFQETMEQRRREWEHGVERERRRFDLVLVAIVVIFAIAEVAATIWG